MRYQPQSVVGPWHRSGEHESQERLQEGDALGFCGTPVIAGVGA